MNETETAARVRTHLQNIERGREAVLEPEVVDHVPLNAKMVVHSGAKRVTREDLKLLPEPIATETFKPIHHDLLINQIEEVLAFRHLNIVGEDYAVKDDGMKLFALLELSSETEDVRFALALRTANDKSMSLKMTTGYRVFICDNMAMSGEFAPLAHKHSKNFDLTESLTIGIDRAQRFFSPLTKQIGEWKQREIPESVAKEIIYNAFTGDYLKAPIKLL